MSTYDELYEAGHAQYVTACRNRGNQAVWSNALGLAVVYQQDALLNASTEEDRRNSYSELAQVYLELEDPDTARQYVNRMFQVIPNDIIAHMLNLQVAILQYKKNRNLPRYFAFSERAETGQTLRRLGQGFLDAKAIDGAALTLISQITEQVSAGKLNPTVYIGILGLALEIGVPALRYCGKDDTVRKLCGVPILAKWSAYTMSQDEQESLASLKHKARSCLVV